MTLNRRECLLAAGALLLAGTDLADAVVNPPELSGQPVALDDGPPASQPANPPASQPSGHVIDAGPVDPNAKDGVDDHHKDGYFLIHAGGKLLALSAICTHKSCHVLLQSDNSYYCKCHKSAFDAQGLNVKGPAKRPLPYYAVHIDGHGHAIINLDEKLTHDQAVQKA